MRDIYQTVTDQIVAELKIGVRPWLQRWSETPGLNVPANAVSGRPYSGINTVLLWTTRHHNWPYPRFLTYRQALEAGGHVCKGEHGHHIVFVKDLVRRSADEGNEEEKPATPPTFAEIHRSRMLKSYTVFNVAQCDELPAKLITPPPKSLNQYQRDLLIDEFIAATGAKLIEESTGDRAYYSVTRDCIVLPRFEVFLNRQAYYATLFHELIHWTGHESRLDRQLGERFGSHATTAEELIAELGAAFLCAEFSIDGFVSHAAYIGQYLELSQSDSRAVFTAAAKAQAAVDFLREQLLKDSTPVSASFADRNLREHTMYEVPHRNGGLTIREDNDDGDQIVVEPVIGAFNPVRGNLRCVCGTSLEPWSVRSMEAGSAELCCPHCHRTLADITLTLKTHRR